MFPAKCQWCYWGQVGDARWDLWFTWAAGGGGQIFKGDFQPQLQCQTPTSRRTKQSNIQTRQIFWFTWAVERGGQIIKGGLATPTPMFYSNIQEDKGNDTFNKRTPGSPEQKEEAKWQIFKGGLSTPTPMFYFFFQHLLRNYILWII